MRLPEDGHAEEAPEDAEVYRSLRTAIPGLLDSYAPVANLFS